MANACKEADLVPSSTGVFQLSGEPAVVINGVPDALPTDGALVACDVGADTEPQRTGFGGWLVGREVQKLFGDHFYNGNVTNFDKETGWYRVVYEDGDFEDLEWQELEEVLLPLDINIPLKTLALKKIKECQKPTDRHGENVSGSRKHQAKKLEGK